MKEIKDERIELKRLKNIRFAFIIQSLGIGVILLFQLIKDGIMKFGTNPLWILVIVVSIVLSYQNYLIASDLEDKNVTPWSYYWILTIALIIGIGTTVLVYFFPGEKPANPFLVGGIVAICFLIPFSIVYYFLKRRAENEE